MKKHLGLAAMLLFSFLCVGNSAFAEKRAASASAQ